MNVTTVDNSALLVDRLRSGLVPAVTSGSLLIENESKALVPVKTGTLRRSIHTDVVQESPDRVTARVSPGVDYGVYVELGTRRMRPEPYLRPAFESEKGAAVQEVADALGVLLK